MLEHPARGAALSRPAPFVSHLKLDLALMCGVEVELERSMEGATNEADEVATLR